MATNHGIFENGKRVRNINLLHPNPKPTLEIYKDDVPIGTGQIVESKTLLANSPQGMIFEGDANIIGGHQFRFTDQPFQGPFDYEFKFSTTNLQANPTRLNFRKTAQGDILLIIGTDDLRIGKAEALQLRTGLNITWDGNIAYSIQAKFYI